MTEPTEPTEPTAAPAAATTDERTGQDQRSRLVRAVFAPAPRGLAKIPHPHPQFRRTPAFFAPARPQSRPPRPFSAPAGRVLAKTPPPPLRSKRGLFVLFVLVAGFGAVATI